MKTQEAQDLVAMALSLMDNAANPGVKKGEDCCGIIIMMLNYEDGAMTGIHYASNMKRSFSVEVMKDLIDQQKKNDAMAGPAMGGVN